MHNERVSVSRPLQILWLRDALLPLLKWSAREVPVFRPQPCGPLALSLGLCFRRSMLLTEIIISRFLDHVKDYFQLFWIDYPLHNQQVTKSRLSGHAWHGAASVYESTGIAVHRWPRQRESSERFQIANALHSYIGSKMFRPSLTVRFYDATLHRS